MPRQRNPVKSPEVELRHRINAGRVAVQSQIGFFTKLFGAVSSDWKADNTRVTFADFAISERILHALRQDFPQDTFISEEAVPADEVVQIDSQYAWVLDPVDGTNNYALGFPACAISLGLFCDGIPVYGYVYDHSTQRLLEGGATAGLLVDGRKQLHAPAQVPLQQALLAFHFPMSTADERALATILTQHKVRSLGSIALSMGLLGTGYLAAMYESKGYLWDIAAGVSLLLGAGQSIVFQDEVPFPLRTFSYQSKPTRFIAGDPAWVKKLSQALGGEWQRYSASLTSNS